MTKKKLEEIFEYNLREGKYFAIGQPIVIDVDRSDKRNEKNVEAKFKESLDALMGTVGIPREAKFFLRGVSKAYAAIYEENGKSKYVQVDYVPVQFYGIARFHVTVECADPKTHQDIGDVSDRDSDRNVAGISNAD